MTLAASNLTVDAGTARLLGPVSLELAPGRLTAIIGPSGAGKSTLLRALAGHTTHAVTLAHTPLAMFAPDELARARAALAQSTHVTFAYTAREVVLLGRIPHGDRGSANARSLADECLAWAGLAPERFADRAVTTLSGGEQQRVQLARVRAQLSSREAAWLLLDEPVAHLDLPLQSAILERCRALCSVGIGVVAVLHELSLAAEFADDFVLLRDATLTATCTREQLSDELLSRCFGANLALRTEPSTGRRVVIQR